MWRRWMMSIRQKEAEEKWWMERLEASNHTQKKRQTGRKISPSVPLSRRQTKWLLIYKSLTIMIMIAFLVNTWSRLIKEWTCTKSNSSLLNISSSGINIPLNTLESRPGDFNNHNLIINKEIVLLKIKILLKCCTNHPLCNLIWAYIRIKMLTVQWGHTVTWETWTGVDPNSRQLN